jgi:hypothetical protein
VRPETPVDAGRVRVGRLARLGRRVDAVASRQTLTITVPRLVAVLPRELRPAFRDARHLVELVDVLTGRVSAPFRFTPRR